MTIAVFFWACTESNFDAGFSTKASTSNTNVNTNPDGDSEESNSSDCNNIAEPETLPSEEVSEQAPPEECDEPMGIRKIIPDNHSRVPMNTQVFVSMIGNGDASHTTISLMDSEESSVDVTTETACYYHESDTEHHCSYILTPLDPLEANKKYRVQVKGTENHQNPGWSYESTFRTTDDEAILPTDASVLDILRYEERSPGALDPCDWRGVYKYELSVEVATPQEALLSIIQVFEVNGDTEQLVHSIIVPKEESVREFRQVLNPGTEGNRCYRAFHLDVAGNQSDSSPTICWE